MTHAAPITRLAPSPTGALHIGNARTFLVNWALARRNNWRIILRIEDLDGPRVKPEAVVGIQRTLNWLGIDWDSGPFVQTDDLEPYRAAMRSLASRGLTYSSDLSRTEIEAAASAPQEGSGETRFAPSLRPADATVSKPFADTGSNWRFVAPAPSSPSDSTGRVRFVDDFVGPQQRCPAESVGDFVLWTKRAQPAYQLAVVVDDARQGVTHIVRGDDLLDSAARQLLLYRALDLVPEPTYCHLPLVIGADGRRLAKRHGDTRVEMYRAAGVPRDRMIGLLAHMCGINAGSPRAPMTPDTFIHSLDLARIPREPSVFTPEDDAWLRQS